MDGGAVLGASRRSGSAGGPPGSGPDPRGPAGAYGDQIYTRQIYTSTDSGGTWTPRESNRYWLSVASSSDGTKLVAVAFGGQIYTSTDSGASWTPRESNRPWQSVTSSSDGTKLVAVVLGGQIYTFPGPTSPGPGGALTGDSDAAIELQYIGSDRFRVLSMIGNVVSQ